MPRLLNFQWNSLKPLTDGAKRHNARWNPTAPLEMCYSCNGYSLDPIAAQNQAGIIGNEPYYDTVTQSSNTGMGTPYSHRGSGLSEGSEEGQAGDVVGVAEGPVTRRSNTRCKQTSEGQTKGESKPGRKSRSRCRDTPNSPGEMQTETRRYGTKAVVEDGRLR